MDLSFEGAVDGNFRYDPGGVPCPDCSEQIDADGATRIDGTEEHRWAGIF